MSFKHNEIAKEKSIISTKTKINMDDPVIERMIEADEKGEEEVSERISVKSLNEQHKINLISNDKIEYKGTNILVADDGFRIGPGPDMIEGEEGAFNESFDEQEEHRKHYMRESFEASVLGDKNDIRERSFDEKEGEKSEIRVGEEEDELLLNKNDSSMLKAYVPKSLPKEERPLTKKEKKRLAREEKRRQKAAATKEKEDILAYERANNDYEKYGIAFDLEHCRVTAADSPSMCRLKTALKEYLETRAAMMAKVEAKTAEDKRRLEESNRVKYLHADEYIKGGTNAVMEANDIGMVWRDALGAKYDALWQALGEYDGGITIFKHGRGRKRMDQVKRVREMVESDNRSFWLSPERRMLKEDMGDVYVESHITVWPTIRGMIKNKDAICERMQNFKDKKRRGETVRFYEGWGDNIVDTMKMAYNGIFGTIEHAAAVPMTLAGNALALAGKVAKLPLQLLSGTFNKICKWSKSETRWRMTSFKDTWTKGWVAHNDARRAFCNILVVFGGQTVVSVLETVFKEGLFIRPLLKPDSEHYKMTKKWLNNIGMISAEPLRKIIKGMGISCKKYGYSASHYKDKNMLDESDRTGMPYTGGDTEDDKFDEMYD